MVDQPTLLAPFKKILREESRILHLSLDNIPRAPFGDTRVDKMTMEHNVKTHYDTLSATHANEASSAAN